LLLVKIIYRINYRPDRFEKPVGSVNCYQRYLVLPESVRLS
jgi:hypothetical protein